jgi:hypothetical protein
MAVVYIFFVPTVLVRIQIDIGNKLTVVLVMAQCRGLLVSKMYDTAKAIVLNLVYMLEKYGFVPNGARSYYINRR